MELGGTSGKAPAFTPGGVADSAPTPVPMPELTSGRLAHRHTLHSALSSLARLGISSHRIRLRLSGREALPAGTVVRQKPPAGTPLFQDTEVQLEIAGAGVMHALPVGMWDSGGEGAMGTRELLELFDDPLAKLRFWFREGAPLFRIAPSDHLACARWLALFGIDANEWPRNLWYRLAAVIATLPKLACDQQGCAYVLNALLGMPVHAFDYKRTWTPVPPALLSSLGARASRLGLDAVLGDQVEDVVTLTVKIGPVPLHTYEHFTGDGAELLRQVMALLIPISVSYELQWVVLDQKRAPILGMADRNARLGVNTHMGVEGSHAQ